MALNARDQFLETLRTSLQQDTFVKLTLSKPRARKSELRNVYARFVDLKAGRMLSFTLRYATRDLVRNIPPPETPAQIGSLLADVFEEAHLFTVAADWKLKADPKGDGFLKRARPTFTAALSNAHDRPKQRALVNAPFLARLDVVDGTGHARPGMADKLRQIERFTEILGHLVDDSPLHDAKEVSVCDMGAGKGYLTFATHEFFQRRGASPTVTGVEVRPDLVHHTNQIARDLHCEGLEFVHGAIGDHSLPPQLDILIALHACDTATDDALAAGILAGAKLLVVSPCCQKEIRRQLTPPPALHEILAHGILAERQAELLTDGLRALTLEACGYETKVFEFIAQEHTARNVMIAGIHRDRPRTPFTRVREVMHEFGIQHFQLLERLGARTVE